MGILKRQLISNTNPVLTLSISVIWFSRIFTFLAFPHPVSAPDSGTYYLNDFLNFKLVSFSGHAARGWVVPLVYSIMPNLGALEAIQLIISGLAWSFLVIAVNRSKLLSPKFNLGALVLLSILGSTVQVIQHDTTVLATSISNSLFVILLSLLITVISGSTSTQLNLFCVLLVSTLLSIQKTSFLPVAAGVTFLALISTWKKLKSNLRISYVVAGLVSVISVLGIGSNINNSWQVSYSGQTLLWQLGGQSPAASEFGQFLIKAGAPTCITEGAPYENLDVSIGKILNDCPAGAKYVKTRIQRDFLVFTLTHPVATSKLAIFGMGAALTDSASNYGNAVSIFPKAISGIFFGESYPDIANSSIDSQVEGMNFLNSGRALWLYVPLVFWVILGISGALCLRSWRRYAGYLVGIMSFCILQAMLIVVLLPSEWVRQTAPFILGILITSVILTLKFMETIFLKVTDSDKEIAT